MNPSSWLLAASLTFAASIHCVGMCGGFVLAVGALRGGRPLRQFLDHLLLQLGKASTYAFLGALAGSFGAALYHHPAFQWGERVLALVTGLALALAGLTLLGQRSGRPGALSRTISQAWGRFVGPLLAERPAGGSLVVGLAMGLLPCPLVYAGLAAAAASGTAGSGALILAGVGLGTLPALAAVALSGAAIPLRARRLLAGAGGVLLLVVAAITVARAFFEHPHCHV